MNIQLLLTIESASLGFIASIFFIFGSISMTPKNIDAIAGTYWDYNKHIAKALTSQRAEYISGSLSLSFAFLLQLLSTLLPYSTLESAPFNYKNSILLILLIILATLLISLRFYSYMKKTTYSKVQEIHREAEAEYQRQKSLQNNKQGS